MIKAKMVLKMEPQGFLNGGLHLPCLPFAASSAFVLGRLLPTGFRFFGLVAVIVLPAGYGGWNVFSYAEPFFTARSLAEPLVLLGVVAWLTNRWAMAGLVWALASIVHPLQALPVWVAAWLDRVSHDRRWLRLFGWFCLGWLRLSWGLSRLMAYCCVMTKRGTAG